MPLKTILVTAFAPFSGDATNSSQMILDSLADVVDGYTIVKTVLPVEFVGAPVAALEIYDKVKPSAVVMLGQAGGRSAITPEAVAKNVMNAVIPDAVGFKPEGAAVEDGGADILHSTLPVERMVRAIKAAGVPAYVSYDAGGYVCNCVFYSMMCRVGSGVPTGFIHVPFVDSQDKTPCLSLEDALKGVLAALRAVVGAIDETP